MPPKAKSLVEYIDGVHCVQNITSRVVVVGTGLVANSERDTFKLKAGKSLADEVRSRPKFALFAAAAAAASVAVECDSEPAQPVPEKPHPDPKRLRLLGSHELLEFESAGPSHDHLQQKPAPLARELHMLDDLNDAADGPALNFGWGISEKRAVRENEAAEHAARMERRKSDTAARRERAARQFDKCFALIQESWEQLRLRHWRHYTALSGVTNAAVAAAEASLALPSDSSGEERTALAKTAGEKAMVAAWNAAIPPPTRRLQICALCFRHEPAAHVTECSDTCVPLCDTGCQRRGPCPNHFGNRASWAGVRCSGEPSGAYRYRAYAEFAAGIGCRCACCIHCFDEETCLPFDDFLHDEPSDSKQRLREKHEERGMLRAALAAAGNPPCRLKQILELCDTCTGSCGVEFGSGFCGEAVVEAIVEELLDDVIEVQGERRRGSCIILEF